MLHIILIILKIIGIVVLVLLGLLLAALLLVLLVPIRYRVKGTYYGKPEGVARITWLMHMVSVTASYRDGFALLVRIFGFPVIKPGEKEEEEAEDFMVQAMENTADKAEDAAREALEEAERAEERQKAEERQEAEQAGKQQTEVSDGHSQSSERENGNGSTATEKTAGTQPDIPGQENPHDSKTDSAGTRSPESDAQPNQAETAGKTASRFQSVLSKLKFSFTHIYDKLKNIKEKKDEIQAWLSDEKNKKTIRLVIRQAKKLILSVLPRKGKGNVTFGFEDPYTTGQVLTYLSVIYPFCHKQLEFQPVFDCDSTVLEGEGNFQGRIRLGTIVAVAVRILLDKNFRVLLKRWLR